MDETITFAEFIKNMLPNLLDAGFTPIDGFDADENIVSSPFYGFIKNEGGVLYFAAFCHEQNNASAYHSLFIDRVAYFAKNRAARNTIVFNIYVTDEPNEQLSMTINDSEEYAEQPIYEINYAVTLSARLLGYSTKQPQNILKMNERLTECLGRKTDAADATVSDSEGIKRMKTYIQPRVQNEWLIYAILTINAIVFGLMEFHGGSATADTLILFGALVPDYIRYYNEWYRLFTSMFIHIGITHLIFNSLSIYIFGSRVEKYYGRSAFLLIYFVSGLTGSIFTMFTDAQIAAGASGGIFGLLGATLAMTQVYKRQIEGLSFYTILIYALFGIFYGLLTPNIGNAAHIGGMISGYLTGLLICKISY